MKTYIKPLLFISIILFTLDVLVTYMFLYTVSRELNPLARLLMEAFGKDVGLLLSWISWTTMLITLVAIILHYDDYKNKILCEAFLLGYIVMEVTNISLWGTPYGYLLALGLFFTVIVLDLYVNYK